MTTYFSFLIVCLDGGIWREGEGRVGGGGFEVEVMKGFITFVWILL